MTQVQQDCMHSCMYL